jgi:hypothetical protein
MYRRTNYTLFPGFVAAAVAATICLLFSTYNISNVLQLPCSKCHTVCSPAATYHMVSRCNLSYVLQLQPMCSPAVIYHMSYVLCVQNIMCCQAATKTYDMFSTYNICHMSSSYNTSYVFQLQHIKNILYVLVAA